MGLSIGHLLLLLLVVLVVFGAGKLPNVMGDLGKGIKNFKAGLNADKAEAEPAAMPAQISDDKNDHKPV